MENSLFSVKDKVVVLTGGTGILGSDMARHFAKEKAVVVVLDLNEEAGVKLEEELKKDGGKALFLKTNVLNKEILEQNCKDIVDAFGRIDVLINLAGGNMAGATIPPEKTFFDLDIDAFRKVVELNLFGTVIPTMVFAKVMVDQKKGSIINVSSESALRPLTRVVGYGSAKAAISNFTQYMAGELALKFGEGLRVNAIAPGFFLTDQNRALEKDCVAINFFNNNTALSIISFLLNQCSCTNIINIGSMFNYHFFYSCINGFICVINFRYHTCCYNAILF